MRTKLLTRIALTAFLSSLLTASAWAEETSTGVLVPDLTGRSEQEAVDALDALGLEADVVTVAGDCPHRIIAHLPEAGVALERGGTVRLEVCIPVAVVTQAPDVVGNPLDDVHEALDAVYFLETDFVTDREEPPGTVVAQVPEAGADLPFRGRFRLTVTAKVVQLPTVLGLHAQDATALLEADGLSVRIVGIESTEEEAGTVVSQMPRRGADVLPGHDDRARRCGTSGGDAGGGDLGRRAVRDRARHEGRLQGAHPAGARAAYRVHRRPARRAPCRCMGHRRAAP